MSESEKPKNRITETGHETERQPQKVLRYIPYNTVHTAARFLRVLGADVYIDDEDTPSSLYGDFQDGNLLELNTMDGESIHVVMNEVLKSYTAPAEMVQKLRLSFELQEQLMAMGYELVPYRQLDNMKRAHSHLYVLPVDITNHARIFVELKKVAVLLKYCREEKEEEQIERRPTPAQSVEQPPKADRPKKNRKPTRGRK